jgi:hypothetical protein
MKLLRCVCYIRPFVFATGEVLASAYGQVLVRIRQHGLCRAQKEGPRGVTARYGNGDGDAERVSGFGRAVEGWIVTELGGCLLVGRWSRVGEMVCQL